ncbi:MAG: signal peptidase I [Verrucomicrobiaceae bacterium]|nr:signal peptidase I [Verrucomicrobiaceae bacterium]
MFSPRWKKEAKLLHKGSRKFLNYKRDLLEEEKVAEIEEARARLLASIKASDREGVISAEKQVNQACENALPRYRRPNALEENIEVFFVAIVIALGIRAYFLQPFRIPTGSMRPTLNGIIGHKLEKDKFPSFPAKTWQAVTGGRKYIHQRLSNDDEREIRIHPYLRDRNGNSLPYIEQRQKWHFFSETTIHFVDGVEKIKAPRSAIEQMGGLDRNHLKSNRDGSRWWIVPNTIVSGYTTSGDLVLVDKVSYNFRRPRRGEVFVFDTRDITGITERSETPQGAGSHYIKRLVGVPGDNLQIVGSDLYVDGEPARDKPIRQVMRSEGRHEGWPGYKYAEPDGRTRYLDKPGDVLALKSREDLLAAGEGPIAATLLREYAAMGDNTANSLDSRYWGQVRDYNLVGPAFLSLWPFTSQHWGLIR